jgi:hypothetical protein
MRWIALVFGVAFVGNLVAVASVQYLATPLAPDGLTGFVGSVAMVGVALVLLSGLLRGTSRLGTQPGVASRWS